MTREEAIKLLHRDTTREAVAELEYYAGFNKEKTIEQIQEAMDMGAEALKQTTWIPCSERLPDRNGTYLVTICSYDETANINYMSVEHGNSNGSFLHYGTEKPLTKSGKYIVAWMPLPEPYKEVEQE